MVLADQFTQMFREEHRAVRDALLALVRAFRHRDRGRIQSLLGQIAVLTGPHFRYEEESLYPGLVEIFGPVYIEKLLEDHDGAIGGARSLVAFAGKEALTDDDVTKAVRLIQGILPHVSDCDGLSLMVERLPEEKVQAVFDARDHAQQEGLDLMKWADQVRSRPASVPG